MVVGRARTPKRRTYNASVFVQDGQIVAMDKERDELDSANAATRDQEVIAAGLNSLDLGEELIIQKGVYSIKAKMEINKSGIQIRGDEPIYYYDPSAPKTHSGTILRLADNLDSIFHVKGIHKDAMGNDIWDWKDFVKFENLSFDGAGRAYSASAIDADHASGLHVQNCFFNNIAGTCIDICDSYGSRIENSYFAYCGDLAASKPVVRYSGADSFDTYARLLDNCFEPAYYKWIEVDPSANIDYFLVDGGYFEHTDGVNPFTGISLPIGGTITNARFSGECNGYFIKGANTSADYGFINIHNCIFNGGGIDGAGGCISLEGYGFSQIKDCRFRHSKNNCIHLDGVYDSEISGNQIHSAPNGINLTYAIGDSPGLDVHDNVFRDISEICINHPGHSNRIHHNNFHVISGYTIVFGGASLNAQVENNLFDLCSHPLSGWPSNAAIRFNSGFRTENHGTAIFAQGQTSLNKIRHGLNVSPNGINGNPGIGLTPLSLGDANKCWLYGVDSAYLMIALDRDPGVSGAKIRWFTV